MEKSTSQGLLAPDATPSNLEASAAAASRASDYEPTKLTIKPKEEPATTSQMKQPSGYTSPSTSKGAAPRRTSKGSSVRIAFPPSKIILESQKESALGSNFQPLKPEDLKDDPDDNTNQFGHKKLRRGSLTASFIAKLTRSLSRQRSSGEAPSTFSSFAIPSPMGSHSLISSEVKYKSNLKKPDEPSLRRISGLKIIEAPSYTGGSFLLPPDSSNNSRKSSIYNPFESFIRKSLPTGDEFPRNVPSNIMRQKSQSIQGIRSPKQRSISVMELTKQDIAVCFFPEEPDWDDDNTSIQLLTKQTDRGIWHSRLTYLLAMLSYSLSIRHIYHFPTLVYVYGGISFLIPYTFFTIVMGYPLHFLESSMGQYSQLGPVRVWNAAPIARGIGWSMFLLCLFLSSYCNMYGSYSIFYFSRCFLSVLPWQDCLESTSSNLTCVPRMCARLEDNGSYSPAEYYFFSHVLQITSNTNEILKDGLGPIVWIQVLGFFLAWIITYAAIIQGVKSIGKVVVFLVILPYFVLLMLLTAGFMLEGSRVGLYLLFGSNFKQILNLQVWRAAAEQVFIELGVSQGTPIAYGSYCHHKNPAHIDSAIICFINYFTSILCAIVVFNILGALSLEMGSPVDKVLKQEPGLTFITYPEALSRVPGSHFWCISFFVMLFCVSIGTQIAAMETTMTVIYDEFPSARPYRWLINVLICSALFIIGIIFCTSNGFYLVHLLDRMTGTMPRLPIAVCLVGTIVFIYGSTKYCEDMHFMLGYYPLMFVRVCLIVTPLLLLVLTISSWLLMKPLQIAGRSFVKDAIYLTWFSIFAILIWILLGAVYWVVLCWRANDLSAVWKSLKSWGPRDHHARVARTEFSSEDVSNFTKPWDKKV